MFLLTIGVYYILLVLVSLDKYLSKHCGELSAEVSVLSWSPFGGWRYSPTSLFLKHFLQRLFVGTSDSFKKKYFF